MTSIRMQSKKIWVILVVGLCSLPAIASDDDHETAKKLRESGDVLSLETILGKIKSEISGKVLEVELQKKHSRYIYEIEFLDDEGVVWELKLDAKTAELIEKEKDD